MAYYGPNKAYSRKSRQAVPAIFREFEGVALIADMLMPSNFRNRAISPTEVA